MNLEWLLNPATQYGALGLVLIAVILAALAVKQEAHAAAAQAKAAREAALGQVEKLSQEVVAIREELKQIGTSPIPSLPGESIDLAKRSRALRMHHRGEEIPTIAAALNTPSNEIELLLKLQHLLNSTNP